MKSIKIYAAVAGFLWLTGCQNARHESAAMSSEASMMTTEDKAAEMSGVSADSVKLVRTGSLQLQVKDVDRATRDLAGLVQSLGGMLVHQSVEFQTINRREVKLSDDSLLLVTAVQPQATINIRVPSQNLEKFLFSATDQSMYLLSRGLDIDDQSLQYLQNVLKSRNRKEVLAQNSGNKGFSKTDRVEMGDEAIDQTLSNRRIDADVRYSLVSMQLNQHPVIRKETVANTDISAYRLPAGKRFGMALQEGGRIFSDVLFALLHLWAFLLLGMIIFLSIRYSRRKFRKTASVPGA